MKSRKVPELLKKIKTFQGYTCFYNHQSETTSTMMNFSAYIPEQVDNIKNAIIWLSGLTCNEENFMAKAGAQSYLSGSDTMIICPDTSPRGLSLDGEHDSYDFGSGAGFYLNATTKGYKDHYQMYDYIRFDIVNILKEFFDISQISITGHSMGGHGALILGLKEAQLFKSVSALAPIVNPIQSEWGDKVFRGYFGEQSSQLAPEYDATELIKSGVTRKTPLFIDQGLDDEYLEKNLLTSHLEKACKETDQALDVKYRKGHGHSYYYVSSFIKEHLEFHQKAFQRS